jgi:hypothetical protein
MQRQRLSLRDLLGPDAALDRDRLGRQRVGLGDPISAFASRRRTSATGSSPRPTSSPTLNVLASSACSCATSSTTACPSGTPGLMHAKATADRADSSNA